LNSSKPAQKPSDGPCTISGLAEVADNYSGFIVDLWGVVHNGVKLFDGVIPCLQKLKELDKKVVFLSNAPRVSGVIKEQLSAFGLDVELYGSIVTSGDVTLDYLRRHEAQEYFHIGCPDWDSSLLVGIGMNQVARMCDAEIIVASNFLASRPNPEDYFDEFEQAIERDIPLICANPDMMIYRGDEKSLCAGTLAEEYQKRGGRVQYFGKPHAQVYQYLFKQHESANWLAIGDALATDIKGANNMGIDSLLVLSGLHQEGTDIPGDGSPMPTFISKYLSWS
jgi:HAD superfamily hydrolase (TIGR01459 family)